MAVQARLRIIRMLRHRQEMPDDIRIDRRLQILRKISGSIFRIERLGHVQSVQPHLLGIDLLVPETAFRRPRLVDQLVEQHVHRLAVFLLSGQIVKPQQGTSRTDVVGREVGFLVFVDGSGRIDDGIVPAVDILQDFIPAIQFVNVKESLEFQTGGIIPLQIALLSVQPGGLGAAGHLGTDDLQGQRCPVRIAGGQDKGQKQGDSFHLLS